MKKPDLKQMEKNVDEALSNMTNADIKKYFPSTQHMKKLTAEEILEAKFRFQSCMPIQEGMQKRLILEAMHEFAEQDKWIDDKRLELITSPEFWKAQIETSLQAERFSVESSETISPIIVNEYFMKIINEIANTETK